MDARKNAGRERNKNKRDGGRKRETIRRRGRQDFMEQLLCTIYCIWRFPYFISQLSTKTSSRGKICDQEASTPRCCASSEHLWPVDHPAPSPAMKAHSSDPPHSIFSCRHFSLQRSKLACPSSSLKVLLSAVTTIMKTGFLCLTSTPPPKLPSVTQGT